MQKLTAMQQKIYDYIANAVRTQGYPPSVREIGEAVGLKSPSTVHFHIKHLEELGYITKSGRKGRALTLTERESPAAIAAASREPEAPAGRVPVLGDVAAGTPILAQEHIDDYIPFDTHGAGRRVFCPASPGRVYAERRHSARGPGGSASAAHSP